MVGKPQQLNQGWPSAQSLVDLIDELKEAGYNIGVAQYIAAQDLLLALIAQSIPLNRPEILRNYLGPLLCSSPTDQADFQYRFDQWAERIGLTSGTEKPIDAQAQKFNQELHTVKQQQRQWTLIIGVVVVCLALLIVLVLSLDYLNQWPNPEVEPNGPPRPVDPPTPKPGTPGSGVPDSNVPVIQEGETCPKQPPWWSLFQDRQVQLGLLLLVPLPPLLLWGGFWFWQARQFLLRRETTQPPELERIAIAGIDEHLFPSVTFLRIAQGLRRRIQTISTDLDVSKTVRETARSVGWFTPVYGYHQVLPEYLVLIDRTSPNDHQARFIEVMLDRLVENGVFITRYFFKGDPRICFPTTGQGLPCQLQDLFAKHSQDRLVMFSDAEGLLSPQTGELESWMAMFSAWPSRAVLTPEPQQHWGAQERELARQFTVLPLTITGLVQFIYSFDLGRRMPLEPPGSGQAFLPTVLRERPRQWLQREAPEAATIDGLLRSVRHYLGADSYDWLCACAVFPALHWDLTLYLGQTLYTTEEQPLLELQQVIDMARLPWFRYAYMPDWLRLRLIESLPRQQEQKLRKALAAFLVTAIKGPVSRFQLEIAQEHKGVLSPLVLRLLNQLSRRASSDSPLQDYIFREFMAGVKPGRLAVHMPSGKVLPMGLNRRRFLQLAGWTSVGLGGGLLLHRGMRSQAYMVATISQKNEIQCKPGRNRFRTVPLPGGISLDMMRIPSGRFMMGQTETEKAELIRQVGEEDYNQYFAGELPQHEVTLAAFWMGKYPITQAQWRAVAKLPKEKIDLDPDPSNFKGDKRPVENVSWFDAMEFCARLSAHSQRTYTLPSEAQWEYACRAGTTTPFHFGETITTDLANYNGNETFGSGPKGVFRGETTDVGSFPPNSFGLYDLHGNVWEWCLDHFHDSYEGAPTDGTAWVTGGDSGFRMLRGGSWDLNPWDCRCASRYNINPRQPQQRRRFSSCECAAQGSWVTL